MIGVHPQALLEYDSLDESTRMAVDEQMAGYDNPVGFFIDRLAEGGVTSYGIGKIGEIFGWQGVCESPHVTDNMDGFDKLVDAVSADDEGFVFCNLVDFDMLWGHRNDVRAYAAGLEAVDWVVCFRDDTPRPLLRALQPDVLVKGGDYPDKQAVVGWEIVEEYGGEVRVLDVVDSLSTTAIVNRIQGEEPV